MVAVSTDRGSAALAVLQEMRRDERVWVLGEDVARGGLWGQYRGFPRRVRPRARRLHADLRVDHHGRGPRRGARRHAADHRDAHLRFRDVRDGRAGQPDRQDPLHVRRAGQARRGGAHAARHVAQFGRAALADAGSLVRASARRRRGDASQRRGRGRTAGAAIRSDDPVLFFDPKDLCWPNGEIADTIEPIPFGIARQRERGRCR